MSTFESSPGVPVAQTISRAELPEADGRQTAGLLALEMMHEIRNPLEALSHLTYLALEEAGDASQVRKYMQLAEEQVRTLSRIASQTLGFARVSELPKPVRLIDLAEAALRIHQRTVHAKKIHLVKDLPDTVVASLHGGQILQVVSNLIVNALDALPDAGTLSIRLRKRTNEVHLLIADNGHGIAGEHFGRIFQPFFTTRTSGNGLGLALSKKIIEDHGGRLGFRTSVRTGRSGTAFKISLPA